MYSSESKKEDDDVAWLDKLGVGMKVQTDVGRRIDIDLSIIKATGASLILYFFFYSSK